jgi:tetratricopeptide (TPR) repeat protein
MSDKHSDKHNNKQTTAVTPEVTATPEVATPKEAEVPKVIVEKGKRFSECCLWEMQREYFDQEGINAWVNQVPFFITSNVYIASCYAHMVIHFIRDWLSKHPEAKQHPFYIMELGTGSGKFSFHFLTKFYELRQDLGMEDVKFCYIMSDFTKHNIEYWDAHEGFQKFLNEGLLDFAVFNMETEESINLIKRNQTLTASDIVNPLIINANYIFDTVSADAFTVSYGKLQELLVTISCEKENLRADGKPKDWESAILEYYPAEIKGKRYDDDNFNAVLDEYRETLTDTSFLIPLGGLKTLKNLQRIASKIFLISSDKAYSTLDSMDHLDHPRPAFHGSFSMMVNYHAIARYCKHVGGDYVLQSHRKGLKTVVCSIGFKLDGLPETAVAIKQYVEGLSPADYFNLHRHVSDMYQECNIDTLSTHLLISEWDPQVFMRVNSRICSQIEEADSSTVEFLAANMPKIMANFYAMPKSDNVPFEIAIFFHTIRRYRKALEYYQLAAPLLGEQFGLVYNISLCRYYLGEPKEALKGFKRSVELDPESKEAKEWVTFIETGQQPNKEETKK